MSNQENKKVLAKYKCRHSQCGLVFSYDQQERRTPPEGCPKCGCPYLTWLNYAEYDWLTVPPTPKRKEVEQDDS